MSPSPTSARGTPSRRGVGRSHGGVPRAGGAAAASPSPAPTNTPTPKPAAQSSFFTSCLSIPVQGAKPIVRPNTTSTSPPGTSVSALGPTAVMSVSSSTVPTNNAAAPANAATQGESNGGRRAPRKSKTDAIAALANHNEYENEEEQLSGKPVDGLEAIYGKDADPIPTEPKLNLNTVKTRSPRLKSNDTKQKTSARPFGLEECPTYFPTKEEFADPMAYVQRISPEASEYGIAKIVPPEGWAMPFVTDTERFRFTTRLQRLNSIEASSRAKLNFLEQLYRYHQQAGNTRVAVPTINNKPLDLWLLRKEVEKLGGYNVVNKSRKWTDLGRQLGYTGIPGLSTQLKNAYTRVILPYEEFQRHVKASPALGRISTASRDPSLRTHTPMQATGGLAQAPESPLSDAESELSEMEVEDDNFAPRSTRPSVSEGSRVRKQTARKSMDHAQAARMRAHMSIGKTAPAPSVKNATTRADRDRDRESEEDSGEQACEVCHSNEDGEEMLLCDGCDCGFHMFCLDPPLHTIPKGQWYCHTCLFDTGGDYGFDEGEEHSLSSFQARDAEFRKLWFTSHVPDQAKHEPGDAVAYKFGDVVVTENDVEQEFWRLIEDAHDTVEIEYGADVHSTTHGSASPTMEAHPRDPYSKDPWNLNNMSILPDSLLRYIKSDISGMTVPWIYVGMVFSTFCWHNEDHYTYSVNFMHWGETKTWYGIPGADAQKFEAAIKREAPDLFEAQPDLLFQLVTLMNPGRVREAGVRVYACNQRAGEFVVTFPKAYHAGFNQGFNFNEAVNFALPEWLNYGRECIQRYREHRKLPVFSHDELLMTITHHNQTIDAALWLKDNLAEMMSRERANRAKARSLGLQEVLEQEDRPEDQYQCRICKVFCYLSQITCGCTNRIVCVDHAEQLCTCTTDQHALRLRFSDSQLRNTARLVEERALAPIQWAGRLKSLLQDKARPSLSAMRALVSDGRQVPYRLEGLDTLAKFVFEANRWVDSANAILERKPTVNDASPAAVSSGSTLAHLQSLVNESKKLGFDAPEVASLNKLAMQAQDIQRRAAELLLVADHQAHSYISTCQILRAETLALGVDVPEVERLNNIIKADQVLVELRTEVEANVLSLTEVSQLLARARTCGVTSDNPDIRSLEQRQLEGQSWEERARHVLQQPYKTIEELSHFLDLDTTMYIEPDTKAHLMSTLRRARQFEAQAKLWKERVPHNPKPTIVEVEQLVAHAQKEFSIPAIDDIRDVLQRAQDIEAKCDAVLNRRYKPSAGEDTFDVMQKWIDYGKQHLQLFTLPRYEELDAQLTAHARWVESLPWYPPVSGSGSIAKTMFHDVIYATRPEDDLPHDDDGYSCICDEPVRPPPPGVPSDAVQCDHCDARFHGKCARSGGSCPFCDQRHWDGTHARLQERPWHFCYMPLLLAQAPAISRNYAEQYRDLDLMVHRLDQLTLHIGQFLQFTSHPMNQRRDYLGYVRHFLRKLYTIRFTLSSSLDVSFGLDLAGLHRILARQPQTMRAKKRRRPKFTFGQDEDQDWADGTRCICRGLTSYLLHYPKVTCETCNRVYHADCVFYPKHLQQSVMRNELRFVCPLCCLRKNRPYEHAELRVRYSNQPGQAMSHSGSAEVFVDTGRMLDTFAKDLILISLPQPYKNTLYVELKHFTPGQPDFAPASEKSNGRRSLPAATPAATPLPPAPVAAPPSAPPPPLHRVSAPSPPWQQLPGVSVTPAYAPVAPSPQRPRTSSTSQSSHLRPRTSSISRADPPHAAEHARSHPTTTTTNGGQLPPRAFIDTPLEPSGKRKRPEDDMPSSVQAKRQHATHSHSLAPPTSHAQTPAPTSPPKPPSAHGQATPVMSPLPPPSNTVSSSPTASVKRKRTEDEVLPKAAKWQSKVQPPPATPTSATPRHPASVSPSLAHILAPDGRQSPRALYVPAVPPPSIMRSPSSKQQAPMPTEWKSSYTSSQIR